MEVDEPVEIDALSTDNTVRNVPNVEDDDETVSSQSSTNSMQHSQNETQARKRSPIKQYYDDDDDGSLCPICLDNFTNSGESRITTLKCGHIFCNKCVIRWLDTQRQKTCPTCKMKASISDIRYIYARKLVAIDTTELDTLKCQLDNVIEEKNQIQLKLSKYISRELILKDTVSRLEDRLMELTSSKVPQAQQGFPSKNPYADIRLYMEKSLEICKQNGCRVFDYCSESNTIIVSAKSSNNLFTGYGIKKVDVPQHKPLSFLPLHHQQIRDICFNKNNNNLILTASMDKSFKITDNHQNRVLLSSVQNMPLWSCCWDEDNPNFLYVGAQSGNVFKYDLRSLTDPVNELTIPGDMSPVVSVASISANASGEFPRGGLISCKLNSLWVFENQLGAEYTKHALSLDGPFVSMKYDNLTKQLLVSTRPNNSVGYSRHCLCTIGKRDDKVSYDVIHTFRGGCMQKLLSKSCFVSNKQDFVAAYEETGKKIYLWSVNTGEKVTSVPAHSAVLDLKGVQSNGNNFLVSLTERKMEFFSFTS